MICITGATSGIGLATAESFAKKGKDLLLLGRNSDKLYNLKNKFVEKYSIDIQILLIDFTEPALINNLFKQNRDVFSKVECLINNAGLARGLAPTYSLESSSIHEMIQVNLVSVIELCKNMAPIMVENKNGHIINVGSIAGHYVYPNGNVYCATKHAVRAMTEGLRFDLNGTGIRVSEISPGMVNTNFSTVRLGDKVKADAVYSGMTPLTAEDVAESIYWIYSQPKHVNIQEIVIYPTDQASATVVHRI